jgi:putative peptide zinc metalloprotease protein
VELRPQTWRRRRVYAACDPQARNYFHLGEREGWILARLDGRLALQDLDAAFQRDFGDNLDPDWLDRVLEELGQRGLLEGHRPEQKPPARRRVSSLLRLKLWGFHPQPFLDRLLPWVRFAFTKTALLCGGALLLGGVAASAISFTDLRRDWEALFEPGSLPLLYVALSLVVTVHELAHGLASRHFGARVREMGFYLLYFQPCVATDVTDSWLLERRSARIWVILAPSLVQLWIVGAALLAWWILPGGFPRHAAVAVAAVSLFGILLNLNPLLPLDGYYALVDLVEIPNLRRRSFALLGRLVGLGPQDTPLRTAAEFRIALVYAAVAGLYSLGLLMLMLWLVLRWVYTGFFVT